MKLLISIFLLSVLLPLKGFTWTSRGNGGNVVVCGDKVVGFYDRIETELYYHWNVDLTGIKQDDISDDKQSVTSEAAKKFLSRIKHVHPDLYVELSSYIVSFMWQVNFVQAYFPKSIDDSGVVVVPRPECELAQLVVQKTTVLPSKGLYTINSIYWNKLNSVDQAVAMLHEVIYYAALKRTPTLVSSEGVRILNGLIISNKVSVMDPKNFAKVVDLVFAGEELAEFRP